MIYSADITYCSNSSCPFEECHRHYKGIKELSKQGYKYVSIADFSGVCREYISYVLRKLEENEDVKLEIRDEIYEV